MVSIQRSKMWKKKAMWILSKKIKFRELDRCRGIAIYFEGIRHQSPPKSILDPFRPRNSRSYYG